MRKLVFLFLLLSSFAVKAQEKVVWETRYNAATHEIIFTAKIADGWHLYSQHLKNDIGPVPTAFVYNESSKTSLSGEVVEPTPIHQYDENFEADLDFFKNTVEFKQKVAKKAKGEITGYITYMVCNESMCLPPVDLDFKVIIP